MDLIKDVFPVETVTASFALGDTQTVGIIADVLGHLTQYAGVHVERIQQGWIVTSTTAIRTKHYYVSITGKKITCDTLWNDGSADIETAVKELTPRTLLRVASSIELVHN